jgi:hypothetical protein
MLTMADLGKFRKVIEDAFKAATSKEAMAKYGKAAAQYIKVRTRQGYGVKGNNEPKNNLDALSEKYKATRKKNRNELHGSTRPNKSNLTYTGQMLDSVGVTYANQGTVIVSPNGERNDSEHGNAEIAQFVSDQGRPFNHLTDVEVRKLTVLFERNLRKILNKASR